MSKAFTSKKSFDIIMAEWTSAVASQIKERRTLMLKANGVGNGEFVEYKGRPLVRQGEEIFYGDLSEKFYIYMMIMTDKDENGNSVPDKIMVQLVESETKRPSNQKIVVGFKEAFEFADAWLERFNK